MHRAIRFGSFMLLGLLILSVCNQKLLLLVYSPINIRFNANINTLLCGNSRMAVINPDFVPSSVNISNKAENYFYTERILEQALVNNPNIRRVVLACSYDNFSLAQEESVTDLITKYIMLISYEDLYRLGITKQTIKALATKILPMNFERTLKAMLFYRMGKLPSEAVPYYGKYYHSTSSNLDTMLMSATIHKGYYDASGKFQTSPLFERAFSNIVELCKKRGVELLLVNTPCHPEYLAKVPKEAKENFDRILKSSLLLEATYLDVSEMNLPDSYYGDGHHVNAKGARLLADTINTVLGD